VLANGTLDFTASNSEAILSYNTCLEVSDKKTCLKVSAPLNEPSLSLPDHQNRSIGYRLRFFSAGSSAPEFSGVGRAWAQSSIIELQD
jgi:hypothetical protein